MIAKFIPLMIFLLIQSCATTESITGGVIHESKVPDHVKKVIEIKINGDWHSCGLNCYRFIPHAMASD